MAEHFANCFSLGIPEHKLPDGLIVFQDSESVDKDYCESPKTSQRVKIAVEHNFISFPHDDHVWWFFHLVRLATGHFIAICTARVFHAISWSNQGKRYYSGNCRFGEWIWIDMHCTSWLVLALSWKNGIALILTQNTSCYHLEKMGKLIQEVGHRTPRVVEIWTLWRQALSWKSDWWHNIWQHFSAGY